MRRWQVAFFGALLVACDLAARLTGADGALVEKLLSTPASAIAKAPAAIELIRSCSLPEPDFAGLRAALAEGAFDRLEAVHTSLRGAYAREPACESYLWMATRNLADEDFALLDRWVAARPDSWAAYTARGARWVETGYTRRGSSRASAVTQAQWAGMREAFDRADRDLTRAQEIEPDAFVAYGYAIYREKSEGDAQKIAALLDAFVARDPLNVGVRKRAIQALSPKWGGSLEAMRARAEEAQPFADRSPRLRMLPGLVIAEIAALAHDRHDYAKAVGIYQRALAYSDERDWYEGLCDNLEHLGNWPAVERTSRHWIEAAGDDADARFFLGKALLQNGHASASLEQLDRAHALWPKNAEYLRWRGHARREAGQLAGAAEDWRRSLELQPGDAWTLQQLGEVEARAADRERVQEPVADAAAGDRSSSRPREHSLPARSRLGLTPDNS